ncbi:LacI family DNA-binding transcriptional regulator [Bifidobacterium avesanii]|uniref:LacI family DNA-binding transcriptional regulator n=1 Tax=Bifidobacterium avesanii TaxID=1798157 RepID=A0A7K3TFG8_9BIFI|nr:LacI family DNA-binding transcriptional regulator [Bifidobacterium avesanii]NEG77782.1 LacI family DNA-binding transcriptional regulator [Bifidobacterium avesanii]
MFEVARLAGVSHQTVSRVINHSPDVSDATRAKVEHAIAQLGYRRSNSARALASNRSRTVGLIACSIDFYGPINTMASIELGVRHHDMFLSVVIVPQEEFEKSGFDSAGRSFSEQDVDALVFITPTDATLLAALRMNTTVPRIIITSTHGAVTADEALALSGTKGPVSFIGIDQWTAMHDVADLLHGLGHRSTLYLTGPSNWRDAATRRLAWEHYCAKLGMATRTIDVDSWEAGRAYDAVNAAIDAHRRQPSEADAQAPTAIVTANDNQAVGAIRALHEHGLRIPEDVSVVGFDDIPGADNFYPPLTTVHPHFSEVGLKVTGSMLAMLGAAEPPQFDRTAHGTGLVLADLVGRGSVGPARER